MSDPLYASRLRLIEPMEILGLLGKLLGETASATALLYCPHHCIIARVTREKGFETAAGHVVEPAEAYEIVVFCETWEFRWLRHGPSGTAWLLADAKIALGHARPMPVAHAGKNRVDYLVWGTRRDKGKPTPGCVTVTDSQIGDLVLPVDKVADEYMLRAIEYLVADPMHGNVTVGVQRLAAIEPYVPSDH